MRVRVRVRGRVRVRVRVRVRGRGRGVPGVREGLGLGVIHGHVPVDPLGVERPVELEIHLR